MLEKFENSKLILTIVWAGVVLLFALDIYLVYFNK